MQFNLEAIFDGILSNNQEDVSRVTERVNAMMENPQFIFFLFQSISPQLEQQNKTLYQLVLITIVNNIRQKWEDSFSPEKPIFWSPEIQEQIANNLFNAVFSLPLDQRSHFIVALGHIISKNFPYYMHLVDKLNQIYATKNNNIVDSSTYLKIAVGYSRSCMERLSAIKEQNLLETIEQAITQILNNTFAIIPSCIPALQQSKDACVIMHDAIQIIRYSISFINSLLINPIFHQVLTQIFQLISIDSSFEPILQVKIQIYRLIDYLNSTFLVTKLKTKTEARIQFANYYKQTLIPPLIQSSIPLLQSNMDYTLRKWVMNAFYQFLFYKAYSQSIFTPDFLCGVLLNNSKIDADDVSEPEINPNFYIGTQMQIGLYDEDHSPRSFCSMIIKIAIKKFNLAEQLYPFFFSQSKDLFEFEAKLFLLIMYLKTLLKIENKQRNNLPKKQRKKAPPVKPHIKEQDFQNILAQLQNANNPPFVLITVIQVCITVLKRINPQLGVQLSEQIIIKSQLPIIAYYGAKMFNSCYSQISELPSNLNIPQIINKLIPTISIFNDDIAPRMISSLCQINADQLTTYGHELIGVLFNLALQHFLSDTTDDFGQGCDSVLDSIFDIIAAFEDDSPYLPQIMVGSFDYAIKMLSEDNFDSQDKIYKILALLNQKLDRNNPIQLQMLTFLLNHWTKLCQGITDPADLIIVSNAKEVCQFIYPLITGDDKILASSDLMPNIIKLTEEMLAKSSFMVCSDDSGDTSESMGYSLFLASCIVQVFNAVNTTFLEAAVSMITPQRLSAIDKDDTLITIMGALFVIAAYFVVNPQMASSAINQQMAQAITSIISHKYFTNYREMVIAFILLLNFSKLGYNQAYLVAAKNVKYLLKYKKAEENGDDEDEEEEEEENEEDNNDGDDDDEIAKIIAPFKVPFDSFQAFNLFKEYSNQTGFFNSLPAELQQEIMALMQENQQQ